MVYEGNEQLQKLLCATSKNIEKKKIQSAQWKINIGLERKRKCNDDLARCWKKNKKLQKIVFQPYPVLITDHKGVRRGGSPHPPPIGLLIKMHNKDNIKFLALLSLFFSYDMGSNMI